MIFSFGKGLQYAQYKRKVSGLPTVPNNSLACKLVFTLYNNEHITTYYYNIIISIIMPKSNKEEQDF